jgi:hypothetical protein
VHREALFTPREQIIVGKLLWDDFFDFLKFFFKI